MVKLHSVDGDDVANGVDGDNGANGGDVDNGANGGTDFCAKVKFAALPAACFSFATYL